MIAALTIPTDSDGLIVPRLIPVAAFLCVEDYDDSARSRILERLADGVSPRACVLAGALAWSDLAEVERLLSGARPYAAPISGGAPDDDDDATADDFPREKTAAERLRDAADVAEWYRTHPSTD